MAEREEIQQERITEEDEQATCDVVSYATLQDRPEALQQVTMKVIPGQNSENSAQTMGKELSKIIDHPQLESVLDGDSKEKSEERKTTVFQAICEVVDALFSESKSKSGKEETQEEKEETRKEKKASPKTNTEKLDQAFDEAIDNLIKVPFADQTKEEKLITFLKCITFAIRLIKDYRQTQENATDDKIVWVTLNVVRLLIRAANRHKLYQYVTISGGWDGVNITVHKFILTRLGIRSSSYNNPDNSHQDTITIRVPTIAILSVGLGIAAVYIFIRYRSN